MYQRALAIREERLGPHHPDTGRSLYSLGLFYAAQGKYAEAEPLYRRALEISVAAFGQEHSLSQQISQHYLKLRSDR